MPIPRSAAIYARISHDSTGERLGVDRQLEDCRAHARELGWTVGDEYVDNNKSAYSGKIRPEYRRMLADLTSGARDAVIVHHTDRLHRSPVELEEYIEVCEAANAETRTVRAGVLDLSSAAGRTIARIHGAIARGESERMSERMRRGNQQQAEQGKPRTNGSRAYGYERDGRTLIPAEADIIRELADRFLAGEPLAALLRWLNDNDLPTATAASTWYPSSVRQILRSARISGQRDYRGEILAAGQWPAIITPEQTAAIRRRLDDPARKSERAPSRYLLTKLLRCGRCERPLISHPRGGVPGYDCRSDGGLGGCGRLSIVAEPLEEYVTDSVLDALDGPEFADTFDNLKHDDATAEQLADTIRAAQARLDEIAVMWAQGELTRDQLAAATRSLTTQLQTDRDRLATLSGHHDLARYIGQGDQLRERWHEITLDQRRAVIRAVTGHITVHPATERTRKFNPDRVTLTWRI